MYKHVGVILFFFTFNAVFAQQKYWVTFKDKAVDEYVYQDYLSETTIKNRTQFGLPLYQYSDVPVSKAYVEALSKQGVEPIVCSRWLNALSANLTEQEVVEVNKLPFVTSVIPIDSKLELTSTALVVDPTLIHVSMKQMQVNSFIEDSLSGKGITIGVIDAGFYEAQTDKKLKHLFEESKILGQRDFLIPERKDLITEKITDADAHGRMVLGMIAGYNANTRELTGMAIDSKFYLARTEDGNREYRGEEDTWIAAMEWMDSIGVRLISTSLGYAIKMDDPNDNYSPTQMDGKTTRIGRAAQIATDEKGIFLVVSAGNEGSNLSWKIISSPADAVGVLSVGATKIDTYERIEYSSIGPDYLPYLKPNVSCYSRNGTSFSAPAVAGFVSCLMQKAPHLSNKQLKSIIEKSAHLYPYGNNYIGYGVPRASRALQLIADSTLSYTTNSRKEVHSKSIVLRDLKQKQVATLFHKKNEYIVVEQHTASFVKGKLKIRRPSKQVTYTTVSYLDKVVEIHWK